MLTLVPKKEEEILLSNKDSVCKIVVYVVSAVLDGNDAAAFPTLYDRNGLTAEATEREEEGVKLRIIGFDSLDYVFFSFLCVK